MKGKEKFIGGVIGVILTILGGLGVMSVSDFKAGLCGCSAEISQQ